jgi:hypothetical protein
MFLNMGRLGLAFSEKLRGTQEKAEEQGAEEQSTEAHGTLRMTTSD